MKLIEVERKIDPNLAKGDWYKKFEIFPDGTAKMVFFFSPDEDFEVTNENKR